MDVRIGVDRVLFVLSDTNTPNLICIGGDRVVQMDVCIGV